MRRDFALSEAQRLQEGAIYLASTLPASNEKSELLGYAHKELANTHVLKAQWAQALEALDEAEGYYADVIVNEVPLAVVTLIRSVVYQQLDRFDEALATVGQAERVFSLYGDTNLLLKARTARGNIYLDVGRYQEAVDLWMELLAEARAAADESTVAQVSANLGYCLHKLQRDAEALVALGEALAIRTARNATVFVPRIRRVMGHIQRDAGDWSAALSLLHQARSEFETGGSGIVACDVVLEIAEILLCKGDYAEAKALLTDLPRRFADAGHYSNAIAAADYLRHAMLSEQASTSTIRHVMRFVAETRQHPQLVFTPHE
ncbi:MAG: tetratricopeptide repeat protein [Thermoanaerobaculia bacterium]